MQLEKGDIVGRYLYKNNEPLEYTGKILHLDGDKKYSEKTARYYKKMGLNAVVKNIAESKQPQLVIPLLSKYTPDILITIKIQNIL